MNADPGLAAGAPPPGQKGRRRTLRRPGTRLGWWSVALAATFVVFFAINSAVLMRLTVEAPWQHTVLPFYGIAMLAL
jgi:hypothetical protein